MTASGPWLLPANKQVVAGDGSTWSATQAIQLFGVRVGIQTNQAKWMERLEAHFPPLWRSISAATVDRVFSFRVGKASHELFENDELMIKTRSLTSVLETFERQLKMYVAEMARRRVFVHAGVVAWNGKAIVIPGRSYTGKTSLVKGLVEAGATYYSDEYAVFDLQGRVHPYPQPLALRKPGGFNQKKCSVETLGGVVGAKPLPVGLVIVSKYRAEARWRPVQLSAGHGVLALLDNAVSARRKPAVVLPTLQKAVSDATILKGDRGEVEDVVQGILERSA